MHIYLDTLEYVIVTIVFGAIGGAVSGAFVADFFANRRARQSRKLDLIAFLNAWQSEVIAYRTKYSDYGQTAFTGVVEEFEESRLQMVAKAAAVELDYKGSNRTKLKALVNHVARTTPDTIKNPQGRDNFAEQIKNLVSFVESNL